MRTLLRAGAALALVLGAAAGVTASSGATPRPASYNGLAPTPPMGWNDWSYYQCNIDENLILTQARALVSTGLAAKGYDTVTIDDCWMARTRDASGNLQADPARFPHGIAHLAAQVHALGLKFGIYEDAGTSTCGGYPGSWEHIGQDADTFAAWGVDYVKLDGCNMPSVAGQTREQTYRQAYTQFSQALVATGRPIVFSASAPAYFQGSAQWHDVIGWTSTIANLWREGTDIPLGQSGAQKWAGVARNYGYNVGLARYAGTGHWNDPDFLLTGDSGLTTDEMQSQMTLWAEMAAPLISSTHLTRLSPTALAILGNRDIIAIDQDPLGAQGTIVASGTGFDVLAKPLADGDASVVLFNKADTAQTIEATAATAGLPAARHYELTDLVSKHRTETTSVITAGVPPHGTVIYRVHPARSSQLPAAVGVYLSQPTITADTPSTVTVVVADDGGSAIPSGQVAMIVPDGWSVRPASDDLPRIRPGGTATLRFQLTPSQPPPGRTIETITATVHYRSAGSSATAAGYAGAVSNAPYPNLTAAFNNVAITDESNPGPGNLDGGGNSYSAQALAAAGATPGATITAQDATFTWPSADPGTPDNVQGSGVQVTLSGSGSQLAFLGAEAGFTTDTVTVTYTDGTTTNATIGFPNWCCDDPHHYGAVPVIVTDHRNTQNGPANYGINYDVFYNAIPIDATKTVATATLPSNASIHIFAMSLQQ